MTQHNMLVDGILSLMMAIAVDLVRLGCDGYLDLYMVCHIV